MTDKNDLQTHFYFSTPVFRIEKPEWVKKLNKSCDKYIKDAKKRNQKAIKDREKFSKKKIGDIGMSHHSTTLINDPNFKEFQDYVGKTSYNILDYMGYDVSTYTLFFSELWVQEFAEKGGGHHEGHIHYDNHISGFYFLECSEKTSKPIFHDPRQAKLMNDLPLKKEETISPASSLVHHKPKPGTLIFFPAYLEHEFAVDCGVNKFRFIHFNLQAIRNMFVEAIKKEM